MNNFEQDLLPSHRQKRILEILREKKAVSVAYLSRTMYINEATVRRDLNALSKSGAVTRTYGGAVLNEGLDSEIPFFIRETSNAEAKRQIGETAADFVRDGDTVFLDSSSTTAFMIPYFKGKKNVKFVTNGAKTALLLSKTSDCEIYCIGGKLRENSLSFIGETAAEALQNYHFDASFFSCRGIDLTGGLTDSNISEAKIRKIMIRNSKKNYLLADGSKFGTVSFYTVCDFADIDCLITDLVPEQKWLELFRKNEIALYH